MIQDGRRSKEGLIVLAFWGYFYKSRKRESLRSLSLIFAGCVNLPFIMERHYFKKFLNLLENLKTKNGRNIDDLSSMSGRTLTIDSMQPNDSPNSSPLPHPSAPPPAQTQPTVGPNPSEPLAPCANPCMHQEPHPILHRSV